MKKNLLITVLLLFALILTACSDAAEPTEAGDPEVVETVENEDTEVDEVDEPEGCLGTAEDALVDLDCREISIAMENAYLPFNYIELETGEPGGWDYDVWEEICTRLHCTPVYTEMAWDGMIQAVADGQFDAAADGITITDERAEIVDFSIGYIALEQRLLVRVDEEEITNIDDIVNNPDFKLGTQVGTTNYETAKNFLAEDLIVGFETFPFAVQSLISGDVDAVIIDDVAGQGYMGENAEDVKLVGDSLSSDYLGFIYPQGSDLVEPIDQALLSMMEDGFLEEVNKVYFGPDFDLTYDDIGAGAYGEDEGDTEEAEDVESVEEPEGCLGTAEDALVDLDCREITIAMENAYLPFNYIDLSTGEPGGWDYDVWTEICVLLHCTPVYEEMAWDGMIQAVADGQFDAAADGITITDDRAEIVDFSIGYIALEQRLLVRVDEEEITSIDDIVANPDFVLGTQVGTTNYETAKNYIDEELIVGFETFPFAVQALISGDIDAVIIDDVAGQGYMGENAEDVKLVGDSLSSDYLGFIYPKGSDLVEPIDQALLELMENGFLEEINKVYFGPDFDLTYDDIGEGVYGEDE